MKNGLTLKFLLGYLIFGIFCALIAAFITPWMTDQNAISSTSDTLYYEAYYLAHNITSEDPGLNDASFLLRQAESVGTYCGCDVRLILPDGTVLLDTSAQLTGQIIEEFDPSTRADRYSFDTFYETYGENAVTVLSALTQKQHITGYVVLSKTISAIRRASYDTLIPIFVTVGVVYLASFFFLITFRVIVGRPLAKITKAAESFSEGNLDYRIDIGKYDELGNLAAALNYMIGEVRDMEANERKFVSNISHDFRSPLTSIKGYAEAMIDGVVSPEDYEKYLNIIVSESDRLINMASGALALQALEQGGAFLDMTDFDINNTIRRAAASFEVECMSRGIVLDMTFDEESLYVHADEPKIEQVLHNLIDNAIKFSEDERDIWIETYTKGGKVFVSVKDYGCGIPPEDLMKIWNRFYKGDASRGAKKESTGLGLSICKEIIQNHGQTIDVISTEGVGSEFIFTLKPAIRDE